MTITRGQPWGEPGQLGAGGVICTSDAAAARAVSEARRARLPLPELGLVGGDLCRTVGGPGSEQRLHSADSVRLPIDIVRANLDGRDHWFVAHLVARWPLWQGRFAVVMNADHLGEWQLAPRGHPNDGVVDMTVGALPFGQRLKARTRARSGDHLPHPRLATTRGPEWSATFARPIPVWLDGVRIGRFQTIAVTVEPDAAIAVI